MLKLPKLIYRLNRIPINSPARLPTDVDKFILKFTWKDKAQNSHTILEKIHTPRRTSRDDFRTSEPAMWQRGLAEGLSPWTHEGEEKPDPSFAP